jgi:hypothetical protein
MKKSLQRKCVEQAFKVKSEFNKEIWVNIYFTEGNCTERPIYCTAIILVALDRIFFLIGGSLFSRG